MFGPVRPIYWANRNVVGDLDVRQWSQFVQARHFSPFLLMGAPLPAMALDVAAISKGLVEADPLGKNPEFLSYLLGWFGVVLLVAVLVKLIHREVDRWMRTNKARQAVRHEMENWVLEVGAMLNVPAPKNLKAGATPALWRTYRHQVKTAISEQVHRSRDVMAQLASLRDAQK